MIGNIYSADIHVFIEIHVCLLKLRNKLHLLEFANRPLQNDAHDLQIIKCVKTSM